MLLMWKWAEEMLSYGQNLMSIWKLTVWSIQNAIHLSWRETKQKFCNPLYYLSAPINWKAFLCLADSDIRDETMCIYMIFYYIHSCQENEVAWLRRESCLISRRNLATFSSETTYSYPWTETKIMRLCPWFETKMMYLCPWFETNEYVQTWYFK